MRVATWNMKQAVAPKKPLPELWAWMEREIDPDVVVLTEAKVPKDGLPSEWSAIWEPDGIGPRRRWGTVLAGKGVELELIRIDAPWNAVVTAADVSVGRRHWATVIGMYGITVDRNGNSCGHGRYSVPSLIESIKPLLRGRNGKRVIVAGDMNLWPRDVSHLFDRVGLIDLIEWTRNERQPLDRCANCADIRDPECGHLWTHKNGSSPNAAVQQIDFIFATEAIAGELDTIFGGIDDFPDSWNVSDHAPVVADFK